MIVKLSTYKVFSIMAKPLCLYLLNEIFYVEDLIKEFISYHFKLNKYLHTYDYNCFPYYLA